MRIPLVLLLCAQALLLSGADLASYKTPRNSWADALAAAAAKETTVVIRQGTYQLDKSVEIVRDTALILEDGAVLTTDNGQMFILKKGKLLIEGRGFPGELRSSVVKTDFRDSSPERASLIDVNSPDPESPPSLEIRNLKFYAHYGVDGCLRRDNPGKMASLIAERCEFYTKGRGIGVRLDDLAFCRIEKCRFDGVRNPIELNTPMSGGLTIKDNILLNFGLCGILAGKAGQISEGCTTHLSSAVIHGNQLLRGGIGSTEKHSYIQGILVYGHNVSVQGNIVRDVCRGEPVPGREFGRQFRTEDGKVLTEQWIMRNGKRSRMAGAAIYLKANRAVVSGNICTNSGWRSVIEIKTGGKEHFVSVVNNIVDGSALNTMESFGFECNAGRSLWANNVAYNMPHQTFVVRSGFENTFINNLVVNAKVGFALSGRSPGYGELISGNRFINVEIPVAVDGKNVKPCTAPDVLSLPSARLADDVELPEPGPENEGRIYLRGDKFYCCIRQGGEYVYMELAGKIIPNKKYRVVDRELLFNADQSGAEKSDRKELSDPLHPGWRASLTSAREKKLGAAGNISFDTENFKTGGRSLKICMTEEPGSWSLIQPVKLKPGARYRASAVIRGEEPLNLRLELRPSNGVSRTVRAADTKDWQTVTLDFANPATNRGGYFSVWSSKTNLHKNAWIDSVSLKELIDEEEALKAERAARRKTSGPELLSGQWSVPRALQSEQTQDGVALQRADGKDNQIITRKFKAVPGRDCRAVLTLGPGGTLTARRLNAQVKFGDKRFPLTIAEERDGQLLWRGDFTVPADNPNGIVTVWINTFSPEDRLLIRDCSIRELAPEE